MQPKTMVTLVVLALAGGMLIPAAQASHLTWYSTSVTAEYAQSHEAMATFEGTAPIPKRLNNVNGPAGQETRAIPAINTIPLSFHGLPDRLTSDVGLACTTKGCATGDTAAVKNGAAIADSHIQGSAVESGQLVPLGYYAASAGAGNRVMPGSSFLLWHGDWWDVDVDDVIDDVWANCDGDQGPAGCSYLANNEDEFVWRGTASGEVVNAPAWFFPIDGSADDRTWVYEPAGLSGNCVRYEASGPNCLNPASDWKFNDQTYAVGNADNQRWTPESGGGRWYYEEVLVVDLHVVTVLGAAKTTTVEGWAVDCTGGDLDGRACFRDYDYYEAVGNAVQDLYFGTTIPVRDAVWTPYEEIDVNDVLEQYAPALVLPDLCPTDANPAAAALPGCAVDTRHLDAKAGHAADGATSVGKVYASADFRSIAPLWAGTPGADMQNYYCSVATGSACPTTTPAAGFFGDVAVSTSDDNRPYSTAIHGAIIRGHGDALVWLDLNGDGYMGSPYAQEVDYYAMGVDNSPNTVCTVGATTPEGQPCENQGIADSFKGHVLRVTPGGLGWPPGTFVLRNFDRIFDGAPVNPAGSVWLEDSTPLFGVGAVDLRFDNGDCGAGEYDCRTQDALLLPSGSYGQGLTGQVGKSATLNTGAFTQGFTATWKEDGVPFSVTLTGAPYAVVHASSL